MLWFLGLAIYLFLVMLLTAPFILSSRISREEQQGGQYEKSGLYVTAKETVYRKQGDTPVAKGNRGGVLERPLSYGKHFPLSGRSSG